MGRDKDQTSRGRGRGKGGQGRGGGGTTVCVCPNCGHEENHQKGVPCFEKTCPECGTNLVGKR
ncbi:MAG: hypothetical protein ACLFUR_00400 [Candidatus Hadarchaeia archaeon]